MLKIFTSIVVVASAPFLLFADGITPGSYSGNLDIGNSVTIHKTVTVAAGTPTTSKVDVLFLADVTSSMYTILNTIQASASNILSSASLLGDVAFGVASYRDFGYDDPYSTSAGAFTIESNITSSAAIAQAAINTWGASSGGDWPEGQLYGLKHVAEDGLWRDGSARILVWFGDAPGHDPAGPDAATAVTGAEAISALVAKNIKVEALNVGEEGGLDAYGQATSITTATGGTLYNGINDASIVSAIQDAITSSFNTYHEVKLSASGDLSDISVTLPSAITGSFDRSIDRTFDFDVTVTGANIGTDDFKIDALVDGGIIASETDHFVVSSDVPSNIPEPGSFGLLAMGLLFVLGYSIRRKK